MLDFYSKYNRLYRGDDVRVVAQLDVSTVPGNYLCERLGEGGIDFIPMGSCKAATTTGQGHGKRRWDQLTAAERFAHVETSGSSSFRMAVCWATRTRRRASSASGSGRSGRRCYR